MPVSTWAAKNDAQSATASGGGNVKNVLDNVPGRCLSGPSDYCLFECSNSSFDTARRLNHQFRHLRPRLSSDLHSDNLKLDKLQLMAGGEQTSWVLNVLATTKATGRNMGLPDAV
jgi:hypothetical protein